MVNKTSDDISSSSKIVNLYQKNKLLEDLLKCRINNTNTTKSNESYCKLNVKYFKLNDAKSQVRIANTSIDPLREAYALENEKSLNNFSFNLKKDSLSFAGLILKKIHERDQLILPNLGGR